MVLHTYLGQKWPGHEMFYISLKIIVKNQKKINDVYFEDRKAFAKSRSLTKNYALKKKTYFPCQNGPEWGLNAQTGWKQHEGE